MENQNTQIQNSNKLPELIAVPISGYNKEETEYFENEPIIGTHLIAQPAVHFQDIPSDLVDLMVKDIENMPVIEFPNSEIGNLNEPGSDLKIRNSKVNWWGEQHWAASVISHYINIANRSSWEYDLTFLNGLQISTYDDGGHYVWHSDYGTSDDSRYTRKLSASLLVTDPSEYEGGELEFIDYHNNILRAPKQKGTLIIFDSRIPHRVTPVIKGKRTSIVAWMLGPKLR